MDLNKIENYTIDDIFEIFKEKVDAILIIHAELDSYKSISRKGIFKDIIKENGNYHDLIEKLLFNFNNSSKKLQVTIMSLFLHTENSMENTVKD